MRVRGDGGSLEKRLRPGWEAILLMSACCAVALLFGWGITVGAIDAFVVPDGNRLPLWMVALFYLPLLAVARLLIIRNARRGVTLSEQYLTTHWLFRPAQAFSWADIARFEAAYQYNDEGPSFWSIKMVLRNGKGIVLPLGPVYPPQRRTDRRVAELNHELEERRGDPGDRETGGE